MQNLSKEELETFNKDLEELLKKHNVNLSIGQQIIVNKNQEEVNMETTSETTGTE